MKQLSGRVALITAAAGGIGRALAPLLAEAGCRLVLTDIDEAALQDVAAPLEAAGTPLLLRVVDVRDTDALEALEADIRSTWGSLSVLVAGAGVTVFGPFEAHTRDDIDWVLDVNLRGMAHTIRAMLPLLRETAARDGEAHVVCMSSMQGMFGVPTQSMYSASKFGVRGLAAALRAELGARRIGVTAVLPGAVADAFIANGRSHDDEMVTLIGEWIPRLGCSTDAVARGVIRGIRRNRAEVWIGADAWMVGLIRWLMPPLIPWMVGMSYRRLTPEGTFIEAPADDPEGRP